MKRQLLALSLLSSSLLFADFDRSYNDDCCELEETCSSCHKSTCRSCCAKHCVSCDNRPCVDCECFVPSYYNLECDSGLFIEGAYLYWYARETHLPVALRVQATSDGNPAFPDNGHLEPRGVEYLNAKWNSGYRVGGGLNTRCDGWDFYVNWTHFENTSKSKVAVPGLMFNIPQDFAEEAILVPFANSSFLAWYTSTQVKWRTRFNQVDVEIGKRYWLSYCFNIRPYAGVRGAWTKTKLNSLTQRNRVSEDELVSYSNVYDNGIWGAGLLAGVQPAWYLSESFAIYGSFGAALIWGQFQEKKIEMGSGGNPDSFNFVDYSTKWKDSFYTMSPIIDLGLGIRWEKLWCCNRYRTSIDIGWEHHVWFSNNHHLYTLSPELDLGEGVALFQNFRSDSTDLLYGGLVVRLRHEF